MPRKQHPGPRLWLKPSYSQRGRPVAATWYIVDHGKRISTGFAHSDSERAQSALENYLAERRVVNQEMGRAASEVWIADALHYYWVLKQTEVARPESLRASILRLATFWEGKRLSNITGVECRRYVDERGSQSAARNELTDLNAAVHLFAKEGFCRDVPIVSLPPKSPPREVWLTRSEVAKLLITAWRHREIREGKESNRWPWRHVARFILLAVRTGTRAGTVCATSFERKDGFGWIDLDHGLYYRRPEDAAMTKKRRPSIRLPRRLLAHLDRWAQSSAHPIEFNGEPVKDVDKAFRKVAEAAKLTHATPHVLRHTAVTWAMQAGVDPWEVAGFFGMTIKMIQDHYGHHHPDHLSGAVNAMDARPGVGRVKDGYRGTRVDIRGNKRSQS